MCKYLLKGVFHMLLYRHNLVTQFCYEGINASFIISPLHLKYISTCLN